MFSNLFNWQDVADISDIKLLKRLSGKIFKKSIDRTREAWSQVEAKKMAWGHIPEVHDRLNCLTTGDKGVEYQEYFSSKYFPAVRNLSALSLACGTGESETKWYETGIFENIDCYDMSEERIDLAIQRAKKMVMMET